MPPEKRREQLLKAALKLFLKKGYKTTTTEEIARKAGLTKGSVYHHFKNKEDILFELVKRLSEKMSETFVDRLKKNMTPIDFLRLMLHHHHGVDEPAIKDMLDIYSQSFRIARIRKYISRQMEEGLKLFSENMDPAFTMNKKMLQQLGIFIFALHDGLSVMKMFAPSIVDEEKQIKFIETCFNFDILTAKITKGIK
ncbi:MAG: TetR/AcrR family transcriptional regulator [candidate division Zixibacteria bacterium]|nr:TetR/AcrR family transcriptional regulator [candidate division Zixibacteria bacterium]